MLMKRVKMKILVLMAVLLSHIVGLQGQENYFVRLKDGPNSNAGRVEIFMNGSWATVCGDGWDINDAIVICKYHGGTMPESAPVGAYFGPGTGNILSINCVGFEDRVSRCDVSFNNSCKHSNDASVVCLPPGKRELYDLRLVNGSRPTEGRLEVYAHEDKWRAVCGIGWDIRDATVACRQLHFGEALAAVTNAYFGQGYGGLIFADVDCEGSEKYLYQCPLERYYIYEYCDHSDDAGIICSGLPGTRHFEGDLRLTEGDISGRVEVYVNETWASVCGDDWDIDDATVVCSQLGYEVYVAFVYDPGNETVVLGAVSCGGLENSLLDCPRKASGSCNQSSTAWVACYVPDEYDLRLRNGSSPMEGRVEMYLNNEWGTVCGSKTWNLSDANVVCWQLGYGNAISAPGSAFFGQGSGSIALCEVNCVGTESRLDHCESTTDDLPPDCLHFQDNGIICSEPAEYDLHLLGGDTVMEGIVVVYKNGEWKLVCGSYWGMNNAQVVCRQLGYRSATLAPRHSIDEIPDGFELWGFYYGVGCKGTEDNLQDCPQVEDYHCHYTSIGGVVCSNQPTEEYDIVLGGDKQNTYDPNGLVEVFVNGVWGTICNSGWDKSEASVVCRQLGYGKPAAYAGRYGYGSGEIVLDRVNCTGNENLLRDCPARTTNISCNHLQDTWVSCSEIEPEDVRLADGSNAMKGRVEVYHGGVWGIVCNEGWDIDDATVACWQLGYSKAISVPRPGYFGPGSHQLEWKEVECSGTEDKVADCNRRNSDSCSLTDNAGAICGQDEPAVEGSVRLVNGSTQYDGRLQIYLNGRWGTVCDKSHTWGLDLNEASVVCRQLGYDNAVSIPQDHSDAGTGAILINDVTCYGGEKKLVDCSYGTRPGDFDCTHQEDVRVQCTGSYFSTTYIIIIVVASVVFAAGLTGSAIAIRHVLQKRRRARRCDDHATLVTEQSYPY